MNNAIRHELTRIATELNDTRSAMPGQYTGLRNSLRDWHITLTRVAQSLPVTVAGTPEQIKAALRTGQSDSSGTYTPAQLQEVGYLAPYAPLTPEELRVLCMMADSGTTPSDATLQWVGAICAQLLALVATGERPIDPAMLPSWNAEQQLQWLASTPRHFVAKVDDGYAVIGFDLNVGDGSTPGEAINVAMRAAFKTWCAENVASYYQGSNNTWHAAGKHFPGRAPGSEGEPTKQLAALVVWQRYWGEA